MDSELVNVFPLRLKRDEFGQKLGGGLPMNTVTFIESPNGLGKSVVCQRMTYALIKHGLSVTYFSTEMSTAAFVAQMKSLDYDVSDALLSGQLTFVSIFPMFAKGRLVKDAIANLKVPELFRSSVVFIDSLSSLVVPEDMSVELAYEVLSFFKSVASDSRSVVFTADSETFRGVFADLLRQVSDVYLRIEVKEHFGNVIKQMKVERFSGAAGEVEQFIPFKVRAGIGLVIEIASG